MSEDKTCAICFIKPYKYTCPACGIKTCSVECIKRHKKQTDCSGTVDQSQFVSKKSLEETPVHINRDYNFLTKLGRDIVNGKEDVRTQARNVFKRGNNSNYNRNKRLKPDSNDKRLQAVYRTFQDNTPTVIKRQNTMVVLLPDGMNRAVTNKTGYDKKSQSFSWTIEWLFKYKETNKDFLSYRINETTPLKDAVPLSVLNGSVEEDINKEDLKFYLKNIIRHKSDTYISLDSEATISDILKDVIVLEYPSIVVSLQELDGGVVNLKQAYDSDSESESDSGSGSGSDDSDSDDGSDSESDSGSESDDAPEEHSSKVV